MKTLIIELSVTPITNMDFKKGIVKNENKIFEIIVDKEQLIRVYRIIELDKKLIKAKDLNPNNHIIDTTEMKNLNKKGLLNIIDKTYIS